MAGSRDQSWVLEQEYFNELDNFLGGANIDYVHGEFNHSVRFGLHHMESSNSGFQPFGWHLNPLGTIAQRRFKDRLLTAEYAGTWEKNISDQLRSTLSFGGQVYDERRFEVRANGQDFPGPGDHTVNSAARTNGYESNIREVNAGFYFQEMIGMWDQLFLTGGIRFDGSSTFGDDYGFQVYPKFSASYVVSDASSWPEWWNTFRIRGAVGMAGRAPGAFDAERTWEPIAAKDGQAGLSPDNLGNPDLGPERTTEFEAGFDSDMFDARVSVEFTYYNATTNDALFNVVPVPSQGFLNSQLENVGKLRSKGIELGVNAVVLDTRSFNWAVGTQLTTSDNVIVDMGEASNFGVGRIQEIREGFAPPSYFGRKVTNPNELADPIFEEDAFLGEAFPTTTVNFTTDVSLGALTLSALGELVDGGNMVQSVGWLNTIREVWPGCDEAQAMDAAGQRDQLTAAVRAKCLRAFTGADQFVEDADFFKLRNITATFRMPQRWLPLGLSSATLSVTGLNLFKITDYPGVDPESHQGGPDSSFREDYYTVPPRRSMLVKLNFTF
jgi:outer membrane receptor protein involved in Fe transport